MTAIECLKCESFDEQECWCDFYEEVLNEDYKGYCNCDEYWGNKLEELDKSELWDILIELLDINKGQAEIIDELKESCKRTERSRELWVKKYSDLIDEIVKEEEC